MCFPWLLIKRKVPLKRYTDTFPCSCDICGKNFETLETLIKHMGSHELCELNARLKHQFGTVRCNKCWKSFTSVVVMSEHSCITVIEGLSPAVSSDSLESILIHGTYTREDTHRNS